MAFIPTYVNSMAIITDYVLIRYLVVNGSRTILFDTKSSIGVDFAVLFTWIAVSIILFPFANIFMKWRMAVTERKKE
jgi:hypothetical protein